MRACLLATTMLGLVFILAVYRVVPTWLFTAITAGEAAYIAITAAALRGLSYATPAAAVMAAITLTAALTGRAHYVFIEEGLVLQSAIFITGSALQVALLTLSLIEMSGATSS